MTHAEIIEKIKKLLRMKRGGTPGEIENAIAMAAKLAREHGIDLNQVNPDDEGPKAGQPLTHVDEVLKSRLPLEAMLAAAILVNFFNVGVLLSRGVNDARTQYQWRVTLVGTVWECEVGRYVFAFLQGHFRRAWSRRANRRLKNRDAFLNGMFLGLAAKLEAEWPKAPMVEGLVVVNRAMELRKDYINEHWPDNHDKPLDEDDSDATAARRAGIIAGKQTSINRGLEGAEQGQLLLA